VTSENTCDQGFPGEYETNIISVPKQTNTK